MKVIKMVGMRLDTLYIIKRACEIIHFLLRAVVHNGLSVSVCVSICEDNP